MDKEVNLLRGLLGTDAAESVAGRVKIITGRPGDADIAIAKSGIGKVNAALATRDIIDHFHPDAIVSTGVAGGTGNQADILDVVVADRLAYHDVWCGPGTDPCVADGFGPYFTADPALLALPALQPRPGRVPRAHMLGRLFHIPRRRCGRDTPQAARSNGCGDGEHRNSPCVCRRGDSLCSGEGGERYARSPLRQFSPR